jgi:hypothetical protein
LLKKGQQNKSNKLRKLSVIDKTLNNNDTNNESNGKIEKDVHNTQKEIAKELGRNQVSQYFMLINKIATKILDYAKDHQEGRVAQNATNVTFNFTKWHKHFRNC